MISHLAAAVGLTPATFVVTAVIFAVIAALFLFTRAPEKVDTDAPFPPQATISDYGNVPESQYTSTDGTADIPTRFAEEGIASAEECPEMTIPQLFQKAVDAKPDQIALRVERLNEDVSAQGWCVVVGPDHSSRFLCNFSSVTFCIHSRVLVSPNFLCCAACQEERGGVKGGGPRTRWCR